jgi:hypothetical protein
VHVYKTPKFILHNIMYVIVVSTDIVSSSKLWLINNGEWMRDRILFHNAIIQNWADAHEFNILPSSPEGDAFILWKIAVKEGYIDKVKHLQAQFKYHLDKTGELAVHSEFMTDGDKLADKNTVKDEKELVLEKVGIYIRVGIAYHRYTGAPPTSSLWKEVKYMHAKHPAGCGGRQRLTTYTGKLVTNSETLETISPAGGLAVAETLEDTTITVTRDDIFEYKRSGHEYAWAVRNRRRFAKTSLMSYVKRESKAVLFIKTRGKTPWPELYPWPYKGKLIKTKRGNTQILTFSAEDKGHIAKCESSIMNALRYVNACVEKTGITPTEFNVGISAGHVRIRYSPFITLDACCWVEDIFGDTVNLAARAAGAGLVEESSEYSAMNETLGTIYAEHTVTAPGGVVDRGDIRKRKLRDLFNSKGQLSHITVPLRADIKRKDIHAGEGGVLAKFTIIIKP